MRGALSAGIVEIFAIGLGLAALALLLVIWLPRIELATWTEATPEATAETAEASLATRLS